MDIAARAPMPGKTPTSVPRKTPKKQNNKFVGVSAVWNPMAILPMRSPSRSIMKATETC